MICPQVAITNVFCFLALVSLKTSYIFMLRKQLENEMKQLAIGKAGRFISWFTTILGIPSIIVYILVLIVLFKYRKDNFDSSFFTLFISTGIGDIGQFFLRLFWSKLPRLFEPLSDLATSSKLFATVCVFCSSVMYQAQIIGMVLIAINRFLTFLGMFGPKEYWIQRTTLFAVVLQWSLAVMYSSPLIFHKDFEVQLTYNTTYFLFYHFSDRAATFFYFTGFIEETLINTPTIIVFYSLAVVVLWSKRKNYLSATQRSKLRAERRLAITGAAISVIYIAMNVSLVVEAFGLSGGPLAWTLFFVALDIFTYINPWLLMLFCYEVKRHFCLLLGFDINTTQVRSIKN